MTIMECYECGGKVSINADSCPHCGSKKFWVDPNPPTIDVPPLSQIPVFAHDENTPLKTKLFDYGCTAVAVVIGVCVFLGCLAWMVN
jgi:hypothetical protein